jgi:hypothetical protein
MRSRNLSDWYSLAQNKEMLNLAKVVFRVPVNSAPTRDQHSARLNADTNTYLTTRKSVGYAFCSKIGARTMLLYNEGTVCPGATEPSFRKGVSSDGCSTNGVPNSRWQQVSKGTFRPRPFAHLWNMLVLFIAFSIIVYKHATHSEVRHCWRMFFLGACECNISTTEESGTDRIFPHNEFAGVFQSKITSLAQAFAKVSTFS